MRAKQAGSVFDAPRHRPQPTHTQAELLRLAVHGQGSGLIARYEDAGAKPSAKHVAPVALGVGISKLIRGPEPGTLGRGSGQMTRPGSLSTSNGVSTQTPSDSTRRIVWSISSMGCRCPGLWCHLILNSQHRGTLDRRYRILSKHTRPLGEPEATWLANIGVGVAYVYPPTGIVMAMPFCCRHTQQHSTKQLLSNRPPAVEL